MIGRRARLIRQLRWEIHEIDRTLEAVLNELDQAQELIKELTEDRDSLAHDLLSTRADLRDAEREIETLTDERDALILRLEEWESTRTTGGPPRGFTDDWRNEPAPRVETAPPLEAEA